MRIIIIIIKALTTLTQAHLPNTFSPNSLMPSLIYHYDGLVDYIRRQFGSYHFASDVVHDICIQLIENPPAGNIDTPLAFLRKISVNRAIDWHRKENIRQNYLNDALVESEAHFYDGSRALELAQKIDALRIIIENLPTKQKQVFLLYQVHDMPQQQIAELMGISKNMVTKHFNKAFQAVAIEWDALSA